MFTPNLKYLSFSVLIILLLKKGSEIFRIEFEVPFEYISILCTHVTDLKLTWTTRNLNSYKMHLS